MKMLPGEKPDYLTYSVKAIFLIIILIQLSWPGSSQKNTKDHSTFHVSKEGADSNPGSERSPFFTLAKAAKILEPGDVGVVYSGGQVKKQNLPF